TQHTSATAILGSDAFDQDIFLGSAFATIDRDLGQGWRAGWNVGYGERPPNLTERYAIEPFMFLLQRGLNTITGDPKLDKEQCLQTDLHLSQESERFRGMVTAYQAWLFDYITYENMSVAVGPPNGQVEQVNLKYVNTDLATLAGVEAHSEYDLNE